MPKAGDEPLRWDPADLAPGEGKARGFDQAGLTVCRITSADNPWFETAYGILDEEFGAGESLEERTVLARRLARPPGLLADGWSLRYELVLVTDLAGTPAAVRDHTVIQPPATLADPDFAVVHLSHVWVHPRWRRTGLAGWLRALPVQTAKVCLHAAGRAPAAGVFLVAEMEPWDPVDPGRQARLLAYERAGFRKADPTVVPYRQPDFRSPERIDADPAGPKPVPYWLVLRCVGDEARPALRGKELHLIVTALYRMYSEDCRPRDLAMLWADLARAYPPPAAEVRLLPPAAPL